MRSAARSRAAGAQDDHVLERDAAVHHALDAEDLPRAVEGPAPVEAGVGERPGLVDAVELAGAPKGAAGGADAPACPS